MIVDLESKPFGDLAEALLPTAVEELPDFLAMTTMRRDFVRSLYFLEMKKRLDTSAPADEKRDEVTP